MAVKMCQLKKKIQLCNGKVNGLEQWSVACSLLTNLWSLQHFPHSLKFTSLRCNVNVMTCIEEMKGKTLCSICNLFFKSDFFLLLLKLKYHLI